MEQTKQREAKTCAWCGKLFVPRDCRQIYCCKRCKELSHNKINRERYQNDEAAQVRTIKCVTCGKLFETNISTQRYCSKKCRKRFGRDKTIDECILNGEKIQKRIESKSSRFEYIGGHVNEYSKSIFMCKDCGCFVMRKVPRPSQSFNVKCKKCVSIVAKARDKEREREKELKLKASAEARAERERLKAIEAIKNNPIIVKQCKRCGNDFEVKQSQANGRKYCSEKCKERQHHSNKDHMRRARSQKGDNDISIEKLMKRDRCVCYICKHKVNVHDYAYKNGAFIAGDMYPSIEHVTPLSKGGTHTWDNVKLAHRRCNYLKSNHNYFEENNGQMRLAL